jgi:hypothetical protein
LNDSAISRFGTIRRLDVDVAEAERDAAAFDTHMRTVMPRVALAQSGAGVDFREAAVRAEKIREKVRRLSPLFHFRPDPVHVFDPASSAQFFTPPYSTSWQVGEGTPFNQDGNPVIFGSDGFSGAGFGFYIAASQSVSVGIVPQGQFTGGWTNFDGAPPLYSSGGTGAVVYCGGQLLVSRQTQMWSVRDPAPYTGAKFDLAFADTASPALPNSFGPIALTPILFDMAPGQRAHIWFYVWQSNEHVEGKAFITFCEAKVPLIAVSFAPPLNLH